MIKQQHVAAVLAEFIGTLTLALVVLITSNIYGNILPILVPMSAAITLIVFVGAFGKISGGHFNPAVTIGLFAMRQIDSLKAISYIVFQLLAGIAAWQLFEFFTGQPLTGTTSFGEFDEKIFLAEALGAFIFGTAIAAVVTQKIQGYQAAATIGGGLFLGLTVAALASAAILNPAVALATRSLDINYAFGPVAGMLVAMAVTALLIVPIFGIKKSDKVLVKPKAVTKPTVSAEAKAPSTKSAKAPAKKTATKSKKTTKKVTSKKVK